MMAKPMKTLELHYPMIQFLIKVDEISYVRNAEKDTGIYYELPRSAPSWLDSTIGRALHQYRRGYGSPFRPEFFFRR